MWRHRIVVVDDHTLILEALSRLLEREYDVVGTFSDARTLLEQAPELKPDVIVLDISMPSMNGLEAARQLKRKLPTTKLVFVTVNEDPQLAAEAFRVGASAYLLKSAAAMELFQAIHDALQGQAYVSPTLSLEIVQSLSHPCPAPKGAASLTARQREVLQLVSEGYSMKKVAVVLGITPRTVAYHKYMMMDHLGVKSTAELIQFAVNQGVV